jgi:hypothetical protein
MFTRIAVACFAFSLSSTPVLSQQNPPASSPSSASSASPSTAASMQEFPMVLASNVVAGKTASGTKIQGRLGAATLVAGTVIPKNSIFNGEVLDSVARSKTAPSRLSIRLDSAQWKDGSASVKIYLTSWYYPTLSEAGQSLQYGPTEPANRTWNGQGQYPDPNSKIYRPFPGTGSDNNSSVPDTPSSRTSNHPVAMKNVELERNSDGVVAIVSSHSNLKLDKLTMYVFATADALSAPVKQ